MSDTLQLANELIGRASVTPEDAGCQELMRGRLAAIGFECQDLPFGDVSNFWARRGNRAPLLVRLSPGALRADTQGGPRTLFIDGGFAEMADNRLTVLTEAAMRPEELDAEAVDALLAEASALKIPDDAAFAERQRALQRARVQRKLLPKKS